MTKDKWLSIRNLTEIPSEVWYEYYVEMGGNFNFDYFWKNFQIAIFNTLTTVNKIPQKRVDLGTALKRLYNYYNQKYAL